MKELPKAYEPQQYEDAIYKQWEESGYFNPDNLPAGDAYSIMMPPPNVTGVLHLGHALENTLMDVQARYQRMLGKRVLLLPGTDHAAVATQAKVEDVLKQQGMQHPRQELGREGLLERIRTFADDSQQTILQQIRKMGTSADWSRLAYTFDETRSRAVNEVFIRMYNDGLIYRGYRVVNWSVKGQSTCSDDELVHIERTATLYTFKYNADFPIAISSTRPETKLGDTAVAVNPNDERYQQYIGQQFTVEVGAAEPLTITVIADDAVDMQFGTGALGVTPAHSQIDYEMYIKNPSIGLKQVIGVDGCMIDAAGSAYAGLTVEQAREKFAQWLRDEGLMISEEETAQNVATSDRFKDIVEAIPMQQWFIAVDKEIPGKEKTLKQLMKEAVVDGAIGGVHITPQRFEQTYYNWIDNLRDWNISRQIWWGHRIPAWHKDGEIVVGVESPGEDWQQDEDTLDTWFSSGTWTFSTLGWPTYAESATAGKPGQENDFANFHPTSWITMGHEILFFWMARMILMSTYALDQIPFKQVYIHGILRDKDGKKFSKSSGNGIDPLDMIQQYGTDALRLSLMKGITPGNDARFYEEKVVDARNFVNKLWNITRYVLSQNDMAQEDKEVTELSQADAWIQSRLHSLIAETTQLLNDQQFSQASELLYSFVWNEFADWYVELAKLQPNPVFVRNILKTVLQLLHPFTPFVTEVLWEELGETDMLMVSQWPKAESSLVNMNLEQNFSHLQDIITQIRNMRQKYNISYKQEIGIYTEQEIALNEKQIIKKICKVNVAVGRMTGNAIDIVNARYKIQVHVGDVINIEAEQKRLQKEITQLEKQVAGFQAKLGNESYVDGAPEQVVQETRNKLAEAEAELKVLQETLNSLQ